MSAPSWSRKELIAVDRGRDHRRFAGDGDERLDGILGEDNPIYRLDVIIVFWSMHRQMLIRQQTQMGMRHRGGMPVVRIATV